MTVLVAPAPRIRTRDGSRQSPLAVAHVRLMILTLLFAAAICVIVGRLAMLALLSEPATTPDRKSTRLNSSHVVISYAVFCLKKKTDLVCRLHTAR